MNRSLRALTLSETSSDAPRKSSKSKAVVGCTSNGCSESSSQSCQECSSDTSSSYSTVSIRKCRTPIYCTPNNQGSSFVSQETTIFYTIVTPLTDMTTLNNQNSVGFTMTKTGKDVILQWEPFSGRLTTNGVVSLNVLQSLPNLPSYPVYTPVFIQYKNVGRLVTALVNPSPSGSTGNVSIYLNVDQTATGIAANDLVTVPGGFMRWTIE